MKASFVILCILVLSSCRSTLSVKTKKFSLLYFADLHGHFLEHPEMFWPQEGGDKIEIVPSGGVSRLSKAAREIRKLNPNGVMLIDGGDTIQGSAEVALSEGEVAIPILRTLGIDLALPGNWEVVYGTKKFENISGKLNYPFIASNIVYGQSKLKVFQPFQVKELNGIRIGIIGFTDPDVPTRQPPGFSKGWEYLGSEVLQPIINDLKTKHNVDAVILLSHIGLPKAVHLAEKLTGIDVVLSSDTHERTYEPIVRGKTWIVEPGAFGSFLGRLDLTLTDEGVLIKKWDLIELKASKFAEDAHISKTIKNAFSSLGSNLDQVIGETAVPLYRYDVVETNLDAMLADALKESTGTEIALSNGFRFAFPIVPGPIRERDLWSIYPINTPLKTGKLTGKQLREFFEKEIENVFSSNPEKLFGGWLPRTSGLNFSFKVASPPFKRIVDMSVNGKPLRENKLYTVTSCVREGDPNTTLCRIPNGKDIEIKSFDAHEAVRRFLRKHRPLQMPPMNRVHALDLPNTVHSQYFRK